jgi:hypothetical protein
MKENKTNLDRLKLAIIVNLRLKKLEINNMENFRV